MKDIEGMKELVSLVEHEWRKKIKHCVRAVEDGQERLTHEELMNLIIMLLYKRHHEKGDSDSKHLLACAKRYAHAMSSDSSDLPKHRREFEDEIEEDLEEIEEVVDVVADDIETPLKEKIRRKLDSIQRKLK